MERLCILIKVISLSSIPSWLAAMLLCTASSAACSGKRTSSVVTIVNSFYKNNSFAQRRRVRKEKYNVIWNEIIFIAVFAPLREIYLHELLEALYYPQTHHLTHYAALSPRVDIAALKVSHLSYLLHCKRNVDAKTSANH